MMEDIIIWSMPELNFISVPEELYDLDYQGHYFRRIKSVSVSLPCIAGPYTTVNCSLRLLKNTVPFFHNRHCSDKV